MALLRRALAAVGIAGVSPPSSGCGDPAARRPSPGAGASSAGPTCGRGVRILVCGAGAVGARAARHLVADAATETVLVDDTDRGGGPRRVVPRRQGRGRRRARPLGGRHRRARLASARQLAVAKPGRGRRPARRVGGRQRRCRGGPARPPRRGPRAQGRRGRGRRVRPRAVVRAGQARRGPVRQVDEIHVAHHGTGGPGVRPPAPRGPAGRASTGGTTHGAAGRPARAVSCASSPTRSAAPTATGRALPDALLLVPAFPRRVPGHGPVGGDPARPVHGRAADAAPAPRRGPHRRVAGRGTGPPGAARDTVVLGAVTVPPWPRARWRR